ncbi:allophycocyanin [Picosynechococcus sp. PCC 7003]|uniref:allophycocyanin subunit alpha-B n=1 Tax=Picosynechococcus sp. PCC 7003 TaxID=374981 RepID=UPI0008104A97|nr:allophycocyanin subunit alpha-B [Picosynechococcus sp. PCC 7003]ANV84833.1 allophycocyanin [Picosynechococcus sp. PCC 7003]
MSVVSQVILRADDELRYPSSGELSGIKNFLATGAVRIRIAETLADNEKKIVDQAQKQLFSIHPEYRTAGGNAATTKQYNQCLRDYGWYLRLVTYGILAGDKDPIERIGLIGVKEMYNALGVPVPGMVDAIRCLKDAALGVLDSEEARIAAPYFDFIAQAMS